MLVIILFLNISLRIGLAMKPITVPWAKKVKTQTKMVHVRLQLSTIICSCES